MDDSAEKYLIINPKTFWPEKALWNGVEYHFDYLPDQYNSKGEFVECADIPIIQWPLDRDPNENIDDHQEARQAVSDYIKTMKALFEKAEKYDDLMGSGNA